jgi:hypothetical protein
MDLGKNQVVPKDPLLTKQVLELFSSLLALHVMNNCPVIAGGGWDLFEPLRTRDFLYNISIVSAEDPAAAYILSVQRI